jgi:FkbM family methyltransferase
LLLGRRDDVRFRGVALEGPDRVALVNTAMTVWDGEYDAPGFQVESGERVVDVGANVGAFAMLAASRGGLVEAYEPHPETFRFLERNTTHWGVTCRQAAVVASDAGTVPLWVHPAADTRHSTLEGGFVDGWERGERVDVPAVSLADTIGDGCDLLKLDCEGAEFELLLETPEDALRRVRRLVAEYHAPAGDPEALRERLRRLGFDVRIEEKSPGLGLIWAKS